MGRTSKHESIAETEGQGLAHRHMRFGWWALALSLSIGLGLEILHALKLPWYLHAANDTRRLLLTLGHAHGSLLGVVNIAFALTTTWLQRAGGTGSGAVEERLRRPGAALLAGSVLLPSGFLLGGLVVHGGDPNSAIFLVPIGALGLLYAVIATARAVGRK